MYTRRRRDLRDWTYRDLETLLKNVNTINRYRRFFEIPPPLPVRDIPPPLPERDIPPPLPPRDIPPPLPPRDDRILKETNPLFRELFARRKLAPATRGLTDSELAYIRALHKKETDEEWMKRMNISPADRAKTPTIASALNLADSLKKSAMFQRLANRNNVSGLAGKTQFYKDRRVGKLDPSRGAMIAKIYGGSSPEMKAKMAYVRSFKRN